MQLRSLPFVRCSVVILWLFASANALRAQDDDSALRKRFVEGVKQAAKKLDSVSFRAQCKYVAVQSGANVNVLQNVDRRSYDIAIRGQCGLEARRSQIRGTIIYSVRNSSYAFILEQSPNGGQNKVLFVEKLGVDPSIDALVAEREKTPRAMLLAGYYLWRQPLALLLESGALTVDRVCAITSDGKQLVRVEFQCLVKDQSGKPEFRVTDGYLVCDPQREWALVEYGGRNHYFANDSESQMTAVLEYGDTIAQMPIATKIRMTIRSLKTDYRSESVIRIKVTDRNVPEEVFYLSHYGLPEPDFGESDRQM